MITKKLGGKTKSEMYSMISFFYKIYDVYLQGKKLRRIILNTKTSGGDFYFLQFLQEMHFTFLVSTQMALSSRLKDSQAGAEERATSGVAGRAECLNGAHTGSQGGRWPPVARGSCLAPNSSHPGSLSGAPRRKGPWGARSAQKFCQNYTWGLTRATQPRAACRAGVEFVMRGRALSWEPSLSSGLSLLFSGWC